MDWTYHDQRIGQKLIKEIVKTGFKIFKYIFKITEVFIKNKSRNVILMKGKYIFSKIIAI